MNIELLEEVWQEQKRFLRDALVDGAVWDKQTGLVISSHGNAREDFIALFTQVIADIDDTLLGSGFPTLDKYLTVNIEELGLVIVIIIHENNVLQGLSIDKSKVNLGILFNISIPKALAKVAQAQQS